MRILSSGPPGIGTSGSMRHIVTEILRIIVIAMMPTTPQREIFQVSYPLIAPRNDMVNVAIHGRNFTAIVRAHHLRSYQRQLLR